MQKIIKVVGAVIYNPQTDSYFVGQRGRKKRLPLKWEFIGGKMEDGEDLASVMEREFKEEIGIKITAGKLLGTKIFNYGKKIGKVEINFIECDKFEEILNPDSEVYEICRWVKKIELPGLDWIEADKDFAINLSQNR